MADASALAVSSIAIGQTVTAYTYFLPRLSEVRQDETMRASVYIGQAAAGGVSLLTAVIISNITGSKIPIFVSVIIAGFLAAIYHYAMLQEA